MGSRGFLAAQGWRRRRLAGQQQIKLAACPRNQKNQQIQTLKATARWLLAFLPPSTVLTHGHLPVKT